MHRSLRVLLGFTLYGAALCAFAAPAAELEVHDAWVQASLPGQQAGAAFMTLTSPVNAQITGVTSPRAAVVQIHEMKMSGSTMSMRPVGTLTLQAGKPVVLTPDGLHLMLFDLKKPLVAGEQIPVTFAVKPEGQPVGSINTTIEVRATAVR